MHIDFAPARRDHSTTSAPCSDLLLPRGMAMSSHFSGATAQARLDRYERILEQSLDNDFSVPEQQPIARCQLPLTAYRVFKQLFQGVREALVGKTVNGSANTIELNADGVSISPIEPERSIVFPTTFSGVLKSFRGCERPFTDLVSTLTDSDSQDGQAQGKLVAAATMLDEAANIETKNSVRAEICRLMVDIGRSIDGNPLNLRPHIEYLISHQFHALRPVPETRLAIADADSDSGMQSLSKHVDGGMRAGAANGFDSDPAAQSLDADPDTPYDFYHWKTQETDIERIAIDESDAGEPLFFELNYAESATPGLEGTNDPRPVQSADALPSSASANAVSLPSSSGVGTSPVVPSARHRVLIDGAVLSLHPDAEGVLRWAPIPMTLYEGARPPAAVAHQWIQIDDVKHIQLDGSLYPVLETTPGCLWIYSRQHPDLPFIPLANEHGQWRVKQAPAIADAEPRISASEPPVLYRDGQKFVRSGTAYRAVDRSPIIGEENMVPFVAALQESGPLTGPNEDGFLVAAPDRRLIEGANGYYAVDVYDPVSGDVLIEGMSETTGQVLRYNRATGQWRVVDRSHGPHATTSSLAIQRLSHYEERLPHYPFLRTHKKLRSALKNLWSIQHDLKIKSINRAASQHVSPTERDQLFSARAFVNRRLHKISHWQTLSAIDKQIADSKAQASLFDLFPLPHPQVGMCGEHAALAFHLLPTKVKKTGQATRISFFERSSGRAHEAVLIGDRPQVILDFWGDLTQDGTALAAPLPKHARAAFAQYLFTHRNELFIVDTWGSRQLIDLKAAASPQEALSEILVNLQEAGFGRGLSHDFTVTASVPRRLPKR